MAHDAAQAEMLYPGTATDVDSGAAPVVTGRAFVLGLLLSCGMAGLNCWIETLFNVHFLGGVQMPFGAVFVLLFFVLAINAPLRALHRRARHPLARRFKPFTPVELLTIYAMLLFAALLSTPGTDTFFLTMGPTLFYFSTRENRWAALFYRHVPSWLAPGWNGETYRREVIEPLYNGGLSFSAIPWHAWSVMLLAWGVFLALVYATLFFMALGLRRQWIENEALAFPLLQLPLQMVEIEDGESHPPLRAFWHHRGMWAGFVLAAAFHLLHGLHNYYPDWPEIAGFQGEAVWFVFTERPWNAIHDLSAQLYLGAIGVAYLLTREVSFSFWFFLLLYHAQLVLGEQMGFATRALPHDDYLGRPIFITFQSIGGWGMMAALLLWTARHHLLGLLREAVHPTPMRAQAEDSQAGDSQAEEPFSARFVVGGFVLSCMGLLLWSWFAGINGMVAFCFFAIYLMASLVLARLVIEGGLLMPQLTFAPLEWMATGLIGGANMGASNMTGLSFLQTPLMSDTRTNVLPAFLHTLKIAHEMKLDRRDVRRLMGSVCAAIAATLIVTIVAALSTLYAAGGLRCYNWFSYLGPRQSIEGAARMIQAAPEVAPSRIGWTLVGAGVVWLLTLARNRFLWFPLHPLGFIAATSFPIERLWFSFFVAWLIKSLLLKYGGGAAMRAARPFMIGLVLGNLSAMVAWMLFGFYQGGQIPYFPA